MSTLEEIIQTQAAHFALLLNDISSIPIYLLIPSN